MKVNTLLKALMYTPDEAELFTENMDLISRCNIDTLSAAYGDFKVAKFNIGIVDDMCILELILK